MSNARCKEIKRSLVTNYMIRQLIFTYTQQMGHSFDKPAILNVTPKNNRLFPDQNSASYLKNKRLSQYEPRVRVTLFITRLSPTVSMQKNHSYAGYPSMSIQQLTRQSVFFGRGGVLFILFRPLILMPISDPCNFEASSINRV
jgi:hypothetical protein